MREILVIGAGVTGGYTAAHLFDNGAEISLLARGEKADRLEQDGLRLRDGITGAERTVHLPIVREPVEKKYEIVMVCVQGIHRPAIEQLIQRLPGRPVVWFLGNTVQGYENAGTLLGRDRIVGGFPTSAMGKIPIIWPLSRSWISPSRYSRLLWTWGLTPTRHPR